MLPIKLPLNAAFAAATQALGTRLDPYQGYNFVIEIEGLLTGSFSEVNGLEWEVNVETVEEGGVNTYAHKLPGRASYPQNLVLKHGVTDLDTLWNWYSAVTRGVIKRKSGTIYLLDRQRLPAMWWNFSKALPVKWSGPQLSADSSSVAFESIELIHQGISKSAASQALSLLRGGAQLAGFTGF